MRNNGIPMTQNGNSLFSKVAYWKESNEIRETDRKVTSIQ